MRCVWLWCINNRRVVQTALALVLIWDCGGVHADTSAPWFRGVASAVIPGAGQAGNGDYPEAAMHFGIFAVSVYGALHYQNQSDYLDADERYDEDNNREFINKTTLRYDYAARLATDVTLYSGYAAYRDARLRDNAGFRTPAPRESLSDLAVAPFSFKFLARPTTFIPLAIDAALLYRYKDSKDAYGIYRAKDVSQRDLQIFNLTANEMTAVGEEAFFRGFLNNEFSNRFGDGWGLATSSTIFGLAHSGLGQSANSLQAALAGAYFGWLHQRNGFQTGEGVALHYWINVLAGISAIHNGGRAELLHVQLPF
ncbi:MAG: CPBP family intramembrane metalloprotease [Gammaproteobacteria bacterium]|nr:CPBP family intramembrane metalloprotease [Gammaproteobacteria bacterium]